MKKVVFIIMVMFLVSCAGLGMPEPQTMNERIGVAEATLIGLGHTAIDLKNQDVISAQEAREIWKALDMAGTAIDHAKWARAESKKNSELAIANKILIEVNKILIEKQGGSQ